MVILYLESIFGDIEGEEVEEDVGGGTEGSNSDMVARLKLKLDEKHNFSFVFSLRLVSCKKG